MRRKLRTQNVTKQEEGKSWQKILHQKSSKSPCLTKRNQFPNGKSHHHFVVANSFPPFLHHSRRHGGRTPCHLVILFVVGRTKWYWKVQRIKRLLDFWCLIFGKMTLQGFWVSLVRCIYTCENYIHQRLVEVATDLVLYTFYRAHWHIVTCDFNPMDALRPPLSIRWGWSLQAASNCTKVMSETKRWTSLGILSNLQCLQKRQRARRSPLAMYQKPGETRPAFFPAS